ncbi:MAG: hypothetical protein ABC360_07190 [Acetomicrobium sp.]
MFREFERYIDTKGDFPWDDRLISLDGLLEEGKSKGILFGEELLPFKFLISLVVKIKI